MLRDDEIFGVENELLSVRRPETFFAIPFEEIPAHVIIS